MPKKTAVEYEAMIGGLMTRIEDLYTKLGNATANAEAWEAKAKKLESKEPRLVIDWESMCKDRDKTIEELEAILRGVRFYIIGEALPTKSEALAMIDRAIGK